MDCDSLSDFRRDLFLQKNPAIDNDYILHHSDFFFTFENRANYCYLLSLYYLLSHQKCIRNHWDSIIQHETSLLPGFLTMYKLCHLQTSQSPEFSDWVMTGTEPLGKKQQDVVEFLLQHFEHASSYEIR